MDPVIYAQLSSPPLQTRRGNGGLIRFVVRALHSKIVLMHCLVAKALKSALSRRIRTHLLVDFNQLSVQLIQFLPVSGLCG